MRRDRARRPPVDLVLLEQVRSSAFWLGLRGPLAKQLLRVAALEPSKWSSDERALVQLALMAMAVGAAVLDEKYEGSTAQAAEWAECLVRLGVRKKRAIAEVTGQPYDAPRFKAVAKALQRRGQKARRVSPSVSARRRGT